MGPLKLFKSGKDRELNQITILRRGEPYGNQDLALTEKQYLSKIGWAKNILKFQKKTRERHHREARKRRINQKTIKKGL